MNESDSERVASRLVESGFNLVPSDAEADVVLLNTCSVREKAEQKVYSRLGLINKKRKNNLPIIGLLGCVAQLEGTTIFRRSPLVNFVAGTRATDRVPSLIQRAFEGEKDLIDLGERLNEEEWGVSRLQRHSPHVAFLPIIEGCNKFCSYCIVPYSRGRERSRPANEILEDIKGLRSEGFKEVHLIGQNVNSYRPKSEIGLEGFDGATPFSRLLRAVASTGMPRVKFTTSFPRDFHRDIVSAIDENENLCNWVHLPVQSGNDRILKAMRRGYLISDYLKSIELIKGARRDISLTSDIIVGFPGETDDEFKDTMSLVERCEYDGLYIFKYSERKGTPAAKIGETVSEEAKSVRFARLESLQRFVQKSVSERYIGRRVSVLVEGISARGLEDLTGHTTCHKVINFKGDAHLIGEIVNVTVTEVKSNSLFGELEAV